MKKRVLGAVAIGAFIIGGCGDDASSAGNVEEYCRLSAASAESASLPTDEQIQAFLNAAPPEIRDDVRVLVDALTGVENPEDAEELVAAFDDPAVVEASERLDEFVAENCD